MNNLAYTLGVILGDGWIQKDTSHYTIKMETVNKSFALRFKRALSKVSKNKVFFYYWRRKTNLYGKIYEINLYSVKTYSKSLFRILRWLRLLVFRGICSFHTKFLQSLVKGFYDSEGCYCKYDKGHGYFYVSFSNTNAKLLKYFQGILEKFSISCSGIYPTPKRGRMCFNLMIYRQSEVNKIRKLLEEA